MKYFIITLTVRSGFAEDTPGTIAEAILKTLEDCLPSVTVIAAESKESK